MKKELIDIAKEAHAALESVKNSETLERLNTEYLGRKGKLTALLKKIPTLTPSDRKELGSIANAAKEELMELVERKRTSFSGGGKKEHIDYTLPGTATTLGGLNPLTQFTDRIVSNFERMGFEFVPGVDVDTQENNFDLLNIPKDHPARDEHDTFYIVGHEDWVLRTHVSNMQIRGMKTRKPPVRYMYPGRCYRNEATDASHEATFTQFEVLVIDEGIAITHLIGALKEFFKGLYDESNIRLRPNYFPFTEPSYEVDMACIICKQKGCSVCSQTGWLEMLGSGMVHPNVLKNMGVDPKKYSGFAFGAGVDRLMMLYYGIDDVRLAYQGDLRFLKQFS